MLTVLHHLPPGLLEVPARELGKILSGPTLIHLVGRRSRPLFVSILLHGNEISGLLVMQTLLRGLDPEALPRSLSLLVGNVAAASRGVRHLPGQPDYNRIWCHEDTPEAAMAARVVAAMARRDVVASIDLHNNSACNPHYACVNRLDGATLGLARMFAPAVVFSLLPNTLQISAFAELCPAVTLECGMPGEVVGIRAAVAVVRSCLERSDPVPDDPPSGDLTLFHTVARICIPAEVSFGFDGAPGRLDLDADLPRRNFRPLPAGAEFARVRGGAGPALDVLNTLGGDAFDRYFIHREGRICCRREFYPAMLTDNPEIIRQDCLGYVMEPRRWRPVTQPVQDLRAATR
ncbi:MAG: succinylglutamate desuccinylase/aspartoacylase family protein [Magnetococcales bacterium]|nr:succinylglutamate desuccinylase/aspartoacylase family protein [Magnetococcales bacterium]